MCQITTLTLIMQPHELTRCVICVDNFEGYAHILQTLPLSYTWARNAPAACVQCLSAHTFLWAFKS